MNSTNLPTVQGSRVSLDCPGICAFVQGSRDLVHLSRDFGVFVMVLQRVYGFLWLHVQCYILFLQFATIMIHEAKKYSHLSLHNIIRPKILNQFHAFNFVTLFRMFIFWMQKTTLIFKYSLKLVETLNITTH